MVLCGKDKRQNLIYSIAAQEALITMYMLSTCGCLHLTVFQAVMKEVSVPGGFQFFYQRSNEIPKAIPTLLNGADCGASTVG